MFYWVIVTLAGPATPMSAEINPSTRLRPLLFAGRSQELIFDRSSLAGSLSFDPTKQPSFQKPWQELREELNCIFPHLLL